MYISIGSMPAEPHEKWFAMLGRVPGETEIIGGFLPTSEQALDFARREAARRGLPMIEPLWLADAA